MSGDKAVMKIRDWWFSGQSLVGTVDFHPVLGNCRDGNIRTSRIEKVETRNSIYVLEGEPMSLEKRVGSKMLVDETSAGT